MDSKIVTKAIENEIFPLLKENGFTEFTGRNISRFSDQQVDIINFQSFNSYLAHGVGCTTYSFSINLYVHYTYYKKTPWFDSKATPLEPEQKQLKKTITQAKLFHPYNDPTFHAWHKDRDEIWYVKEDGSNLEEVIHNAKECIQKEGFTYFKKKRDVLAVIKEYEKDVKKRGIYWNAADIISTLALSLGNTDKAIQVYEAILKKYPHDKDYSERATKRISLLKKSKIE